LRLRGSQSFTVRIQPKSVLKIRARHERVCRSNQSCGTSQPRRHRDRLRAGHRPRHRPPHRPRRLPCLHQRHRRQRGRRPPGRPGDPRPRPQVRRRDGGREEPRRGAGHGPEGRRRAGPVEHHDRQRRHRAGQAPLGHHRGRVRKHVPRQRLWRAALLPDRREADDRARKLQARPSRKDHWLLLHRRLQALRPALALLGLEMGRPRPDAGQRHGVRRAQHHRQRLRARNRGHGHVGPHRREAGREDGRQEGRHDQEVHERAHRAEEDERARGRRQAGELPGGSG
ncbi:hypothetical protein CT0861_10953, partial [Colletotrichum tofieldiae]